MPGKEVKAKTPTTLTCSVTNVPKEVTISWWDANGQIEDDDGEFSSRGNYRDDLFKSMILPDGRFIVLSWC